MPVPLRVTIAGGGVAALEAALALRALAGDRVDLTLVADADAFEVRALRVGEPLRTASAPRIPLGQAAREIGFEHVRAEVARVDAPEHRVALSDGRRLRHDALLVAVGAVAVSPFAHARTLRPEHAAQDLRGILADLEEGWSGSMAFVVPSGASWPLPAYELALQMAGDVRAMGVTPRLTLVTPERTPLAVFGPQASSAVAGLLDRAGIDFLGGEHARVERTGRVLLADRELAAERILAMPLLRGPRVAGLPHDEDGFLVVDDLLAVQGAPDVWAAGDATAFPVKQGGLACQQADVAAEAIAARVVSDLDPRPWRPVLRGRLLTGRGARVLDRDHPRGEDRGVPPELRLWDPSRKVDGRHLSPWLREHGVGSAVDEAPPEASVTEVDVALPGPTPREALALEPLGPTPRR